ncbi:DUF262 domain-containing HNH endonuclease family protein [Mucilaginibacter jinjuensis]|uniref:DUF262 domain-containing HNH endonuclease family protein n=1 Tax=Mucilaginibacter jinjuensis TaxID=1176721 RepID=A0ABY7TC19_9SPHI|nr:DUF262 domain-containing HNH endonuclease family protein [Mucilaginibacter jinjuensis]WCT13789.1 DUF262 domain-containing HNH endonuclease family protein [Mucilaginibacter jinjuensis]
MPLQSNAPKTLSICNLLGKDQYLIPLYQRNYAWSKIEIEQLLTDIWNKFQVDEKSNYYIGTLVVHEVKERFEVIDGQQRHTTLTLINAVIHGKYQTGETKRAPNIYFEARQASQRFLTALFSDYESALHVNHDQKGIRNLSQAVKDISSFLSSGLIPFNRLEEYFQYFYHHVQIVRVSVPPGTDINHYFETMNNRGEQLEPHEVLKANFLEQLTDQSHDVRSAYAGLWDACSQMDKFIQMGVRADKRATIFGTDFQTIPAHVIARNLTSGNVIDSSQNSDNRLLNILSSPGKAAGQAPMVAYESKFRSIIDFPNFLLQVLQLYFPDEKVSLDDKNLLLEFGCTINSPRKMPDAIDFLNLLFYYRTCFDRYVIKREEGSEDWNWKLLRLNSTENGYLNTFSQQDQLIKIQSMFHVSQPGPGYKTWLQTLLKFFRSEAVINETNLLAFLRELSERRLNGLQTQLDQGTNTPIYLFNCLDYRLWEIYYLSEIKKNTVDCRPEVLTQIKSNEEAFKNFRFTQNNSVEHVAPQQPMNNEPRVEGLNNFGNLCLISRSTNSRLNNLGFNGKKDHFKSPNRSGVESLKQAIIFSYPNWTDEEIADHGELMTYLLYPRRESLS